MWADDLQGGEPGVQLARFPARKHQKRVLCPRVSRSDRRDKMSLVKKDIYPSSSPNSPKNKVLALPFPGPPAGLPHPPKLLSLIALRKVSRTNTPGLGLRSGRD